MSNTSRTEAITPNTTPSWAAQADPCFTEVSTFLRSKRKTLTLSFNLDVEAGMPTTSEPVKYTRAQVLAFAQELLTHSAHRKDMSQLPEDCTELGAAAVAKFLDAKSTHANKSVRIVIRVMKGIRRQVKIDRRAARLSTAVSAGTHWFADGVVDKDGNPRTFVSRRKAVSAYLRHTVGDDWSTKANKASLKDGALAFVRQGAVDASSAQDTRDAATPAPAPVATQSSVSAKVTKADLVKQAQALGMTAKAANKMKKAHLAALITAMQSV
jgi:predicted thioesterase